MLNKYFPPDFDPSKLPKMKKVWLLYGLMWHMMACVVYVCGLCVWLVCMMQYLKNATRQCTATVKLSRQQCMHGCCRLATATSCWLPAALPLTRKLHRFFRFPWPLAVPQVRSEDKQMKVRMMLPMTVRCNVCGTFMYKGTKFNTRMEDVRGENYLGIKIFR